MSTVAIINPAGITAGDIQTVTADITKFDFAKGQILLVVEKLLPLYKISSDEQVNDAMEILKLAKQVDTAVETKRKTLVQPFNDGATTLNDYKKGLVKDLQFGIEKVKAAVLVYQNEKEKQRIAAIVTARQGQLTDMGFALNSTTLRYERPKVGSVSLFEMQGYDAASWTTFIQAIGSAIKLQSEQEVKKLEEENDVLAVFGSDEQKQEVREKIEEVKASAEIPQAVNVPSFGPSKVKGTTKTWAFDVIDSKAVPPEYMIVDETAIRSAIRAGVREIPGVQIYQKEGLSIR